MVGFVDSHAHLTCEAYESDGLQVLQRAKEAGLQHILIVCCSENEVVKALAWRAQEPILKVAYGLHPAELDDVSEAIWQRFVAFVNSHAGELAAIGEVGLDYHWNNKNCDQQQAIFHRQIQLANTLNKPILIHSRDAIQDTYEILKQHPVLRAGIMHCFSSSAEMARAFVKLGYCISLAGPVTFTNGRVPKEVAAAIDEKYLLTETDSPYLTPHPLRGTRNEPAYIPLIAAQIAEIKGLNLEYFKTTVIHNYQKILGLD